MKTTNEKLSRRQVSIQYGFNDNHIQNLLDSGVISYAEEDTDRKQPRIPRSEVEALDEGKHYVVCCDCGDWMGEISPRHLTCDSCTGPCTSLDDYRDKYEDPVSCVFCTESRTRSKATRREQSESMKEYYKTEKGRKHREMTSKISKARMENGYTEEAAQHLRKINSDPDLKAKRRKRMKERWKSGEIREIVEGWHRDNREESLRLAAEARKHIEDRMSGLHRSFKERMVQSGFDDFISEFDVKWYSIDEARPDIKLAVEIDGCYWHSCPDCGFNGPEDTLVYDKKKESFLTNRGWSILRFWGHSIDEDIQSCFERLESAIESLEE